jgi:AraC family transcriptional regulator
LGAAESATECGALASRGMRDAGRVAFQTAGTGDFGNALGRPLRFVRRQDAHASARGAYVADVIRDRPSLEGHWLDEGSTGLANWQVARVRTFIDSNLHRSIHTEDLSAIARRSLAHFSRSFKLAFGESPHAYVIRRRLEKACILMATSSTSLSQIALSVGFADRAHLCRLFKKAFGQSPVSWRRERHTPCEEGSVLASGAHNCTRSSSGLSSSLRKSGQQRNEAAEVSN